MKKSKLIRLFAGTLAASLILASCSPKAPASSAKSPDASGSIQQPAQENLEPITIDWYINESWFSSPEGNLVLEEIKAQTGITINFIAPVGDPLEKLNAMIASDTLPDLVTLGWWNAEVQQLSDPKFSYSYDELGAMAPGLLDVVDKNILNWYKAADGKTYGYPCNAVSPSDIDAGLVSNRTFLVRKDIYEAIGSPDMRTPEGFIKALEDAKAKFPTALNNDPLIPFGTTNFSTQGNTGFEDVLLEFLAVPREQDGKFYPVLNGNPSEEYKRWLKTFRLANEKGLLSTDIFVDDRTQIEEKIQQGRYFAMLYQAQDAMNPIGQLYKNNPDSCYIAVDGPSNSKLEPHKLSVPGYSGWEVTFVSKNTKYADRIAKLLEWGHTDDKGQTTLFLGKEGVTYDMVDGKPVIKPEVAELKNSDMGSFKQKYNTYNEYWMFAKTKNLLAWEPASAEPFAQYKEWGKGKAAFYGEYDNVEPGADTDENETRSRVTNKWGEVLPKLLKAKSDAEFDKIWADFEKYKEENNWEEYLTYIRGKVAENKAKLGK